MGNLRRQSRLLCPLMVLLISVAACKKKETTNTETHSQTTEVGGEIEITDARGKTIFLKYPAIQIVSLLPSLTEYIFQLDKEHLLVGRCEWCDYPPGSLELPVVGSLNQVEEAKLTNLNPDVVLVSKMIPEEQMNRLESLGLTVIVFDHQNWISVQNDLEVLGKILGSPGDAKTLILWMDKRRQMVTNELKSVEIRAPVRTAVLYSLDPLHSAGKDTFVDEFINLSGGINVAADQQSRWPTLSIEELGQSQPEVLLVSSDAAAPEDLEDLLRSLAVKSHWDQLQAVRNNRVYILDADTLTVPGPRQVVALAQIAAALHPDLFEAPVELRHQNLSEPPRF